MNAFEPDCAVVVSVGLDHTDYLGPTRPHRVREGRIFRAGKPAVVAEADPPASLIGHARDIGADLCLIDRDFGFVGARRNGSSGIGAASATDAVARRAAAINWRTPARRSPHSTRSGLGCR